MRPAELERFRTAEEIFHAAVEMSAARIATRWVSWVRSFVTAVYRLLGRGFGKISGRAARPPYRSQRPRGA
jgi:hypothetical protein